MIYPPRARGDPMSGEDIEHRLRDLEKEVIELKVKLAPLTSVHALVSGLSNQIVELRGELKALRAQGAILGAVATIVIPVLVKLLHLV